MLFALLGMCVLLLLNSAYKKTNAYKNYRLDVKQFVEGMPHDLAIVNTGSTYSKFAFGAYEDLGLNWGDFSLQSQSLEMDKAILDNYIDYVAPKGVVVVVVAACLLLYRETATNSLYNLILDRGNNPIFNFKMLVKSEYPILVNLRKIKKIIIDDICFEQIYDKYPTNMNKDEGEKELKHLVELWQDLFKLDDLKSLNFTEKNKIAIDNNVNILREMLDLCIEKGKTPVVVVPPFSENLNAYFSTDFIEYVIGNNVKKAIGDNNILFMNYQEDPYFQKRPELFIDGGFRLNKYGSKVFIKRLISDLKNNDIRVEEVGNECY